MFIPAVDYKLNCSYNNRDVGASHVLDDDINSKSNLNVFIVRLYLLDFREINVSDKWLGEASNLDYKPRH